MHHLPGRGATKNVWKSLVNGEAMWRSLTHFQYNTIELFWLSSYPLFLKIVGWVVLLLETGYAVFI